MKHLKKFIAAALTMFVALAMAVPAFAAGGTPSITIKSNADDETKTETTEYTYWKILSADIDTDPTVDPATGEATAEGTVAYYVTTEAAKTAIENTNLFNVTQVGTDSKWYVELKSEDTTAEQIIAAFKDYTDDQMTAAFGNPGTMTMSGGKAESGQVAPGYYYIKSTLGSKIAVQTLSPVEINEKNQFVTDDKTLPEVDKWSQIGQEITYTLTVNVPATANDQIVLTDTMGKGLTFKEIKSQAPIAGTVSEVTDAADGAKKFTITYTADQIKALVADGDQTITVEVTVIVNDEAVVDTDIPNTLDLKYGNNYESVPVTVTTKTTKFDFDKVDGTTPTTKLTGAEFQLTLDGSTPIKLVKVAEGQTYRIATKAEITAAGDTLVDTIVTNGNTVTINGLDGDVTYKLVETKAPTSYNKLTAPIDVVPDAQHVFAHQDIENNKGSELPSTGGMGTTILYIIGGILVVGGGIYLLTKKRMGKE